jgi:hypothetical protein
MSETYQIDQIALINAISTELCRQIPGLTADNRYSTIIGAANLIVAEYARKPAVVLKGVGKEGIGLEAWLASDDVGASSLYMASILTGGCEAEFAYPLDPDDFGRCVRMIEAVYLQPGEQLPAQSALFDSPLWKIVISNWTEWLSLYREERFKELYKAMNIAYYYK